MAENFINNIAVETILKPYNPWWRTDVKFETKIFKRPIYYKLYRDVFELKQILSITGPRRVGKTTLLKQIIKVLIDENKIDPKQIVYFSFDDPLLEPFQKHDQFFDRLIQWANVQHRDKTVYFFFDEIQKLANWELYLKKYYDLEFSLRFIISGSASSPIFRKSRESLLGRIKDYHLLPFSFKEFIFFHEPNNSDLLTFVNKASDLGNRLQRGMVVDWREIESVKLYPVEPNILQQLDSLLNKHILEGGFPEVWQIKDPTEKQAYLYDNQVQKVIFEDLVVAHEFRKPENIKRYYLSLIEQPGQEINSEKSSQTIGVSRPMLEKYLMLLEMTDLIKTIPRFSKRAFKFRRGSVKCYLIDLALRNAILKLNADLFNDSVMMGFYAENLVFNVLRRFEGALELSYFQDSGREIDFVVNLGRNRFLPIEVKYRNKNMDASALDFFMKKYKQEFGIVVTKHYTISPDNNRILSVPLPIFLLFF